MAYMKVVYFRLSQFSPRIAKTGRHRDAFVAFIEKVSSGIHMMHYFFLNAIGQMTLDDISSIEDTHVQDLVDAINHKFPTTEVWHTVDHFLTLRYYDIEWLFTVTSLSTAFSQSNPGPNDVAVYLGERIQRLLETMIEELQLYVNHLSPDASLLLENQFLANDAMSMVEDCLSDMEMLTDAVSNDHRYH